MTIESHEGLSIEFRQIQGEDEVHQCAQFLAKSEPWLTLQRTYQMSISILNDPAHEVYVAVVEDELVGVTTLQLQGAFVGYIRTVGIFPGWRNRGIGSRLIQYAEERIFRQSPNVFICASSFNPGAQQLYQRLGYEVVGELTDYIVAGHSEILMRKTIAPLREFQGSQ